MSDLDKSKELALHVRDAISRKYELNIIGGDSKRFYGGDIKGESISIAEHSGVINYQPNELVISARAGTPLKEIESVLAEKKQRLLFEPPHYGNTATIGGTVAANMNGPTRPWTGGVKDAVLGVKIINGNGEVLRFGGEVMKNVAGYDVSRLMVGSMGTLGILLEVSMKVLPLENKTITLMYELTEEKAIHRCNELNRQYLPLSAMSYYDNVLYVRLSGHEASVDAAYKTLGGELLNDANFWFSIREQSHSFFKQQGNLWRISVPAATLSMQELSTKSFIDWGGAQRWLISDMSAEEIREITAAVSGHATLFRRGDKNNDVFHSLTNNQKALHQMIKQAFDPHGIFNPGRMYQYL